MNWHIGQLVVVVRPFAGYLKKGETYTINRIINPCPCVKNIVAFDIGKNVPAEFEGCMCNCGKWTDQVTLWFPETYFSPVDLTFDISELTDILEQPIEEYA